MVRNDAPLARKHGSSLVKEEPHNIRGTGGRQPGVAGSQNSGPVSIANAPVPAIRDARSEDFGVAHYGHGAVWTRPFVVSECLPAVVSFAGAGGGRYRRRL